VNTPIALVVAIAVAVFIGLRRGLDVGRFIALVVFAVYLVGVANYALLPLEYDPQLAQAMGPTDVFRLLGLKPFFLPGADPMSPEQLYLNVLLTVPFGFGLPFVVSVPLRVVVAVGFVFSVGIELAQLLADYTQLALPTRSIDINDVILNTTGVVVGALAFFVAHLAYRALLAEPLRDAQPGPWRHFHDTLVYGSNLPVHGAAGTLPQP
jgi:glycopeptide antibiotics resistance protein